MEKKTHWYAFRIFRNSRKKFIGQLQSDNQRYYLAEQVIRTVGMDYEVDVTRKTLFPSIVFVNCLRSYVEAVRRNPDSQVAPYTYPGTGEPAVIPDREMESFMFVLDTGCETLEAVDEKLAKGDRVQVLDGVFKGAEGVIVRIKGNRRFVVSLSGIVAVATSYIPQKFLKKL